MDFVPIYLLILFVIITIDYYGAIFIEKNKWGLKKTWFYISVLSNILVLCSFKYYNFLIENLWFLLKFLLGDFFSSSIKDNPIPSLNILLPLGLSFHTFQLISYSIEVYRGNYKAEKHFGIFSLFVLFYPQLVAGPIERPSILASFKEDKYFNWINFREGLLQIAWGFFKKLVIADRIALIVDKVYLDSNINGYAYFVAICLFSIQIFADFSGYCDIALGISKILGFNLTQNFKIPFLSFSISEFWKRWHISLSSWFSDYFFTPLAIFFRNYGIWSVVLSTLLTFLVLGLWHGANWTFMIYGGIHGLIITLELLTKKRRKKLSKKIPSIISKIIGVTYVFLVFSFSLVFFRANSFSNAFNIIEGATQINLSDVLFSIKHILISGGEFWYPNINKAVFTLYDTKILFWSILILILSGILKYYENTPFVKKYYRKSTYLFLISFMLFIFTLLFGVMFESSNFIYFQF